VKRTTEICKKGVGKEGEKVVFRKFENNYVKQEFGG